MRKNIKILLIRDILDRIIIYFILTIIDMFLYILINYILSVINTSPFYIDFIKWLIIILFIIYTIKLLIDISLDYINYFKHLL